MPIIFSIDQNQTIQNEILLDESFVIIDDDFIVIEIGQHSIYMIVISTEGEILGL